MNTLSEGNHGSVSGTPKCSRIAWWRLIAVVMVLSFSGWAFLQYTEPHPDIAQQVTFFGLLVLLAVEFGIAGGYRTYRINNLFTLFSDFDLSVYVRALILIIGIAIFITINVALTWFIAPNAGFTVPIIEAVIAVVVVVSLFVLVLSYLPQKARPYKDQGDHPSGNTAISIKKPEQHP